LSGLCREIGKQKDLKISFDEEAVPKHVPPNIAISLYRVAQEALSNLARHSRAQNAAVELRQIRGRLLLRILDDGVGFDSQQKLAGLGLVTMRERLTAVGGMIDITSSPTTDTEIEAWVPLAGIIGGGSGAA
jgi:signal transduction histidine kinase